MPTKTSTRRRRRTRTLKTQRTSSITPSTVSNSLSLVVHALESSVKCSRWYAHIEGDFGASCEIIRKPLFTGRTHRLELTPLVDEDILVVAPTKRVPGDDKSAMCNDRPLTLQQMRALSVYTITPTIGRAPTDSVFAKPYAIDTVALPDAVQAAAIGAMTTKY